MSVDALEQLLSGLDRWLMLSTLLVVVGLMVEYVPEIVKAIKAKPVGPLHTIIGGVLITLGVAGELYFQTRASRVESDLRMANETIVAGFNKEAADARKAAGDAEERAANAEKAAEDERSARLRIEERLAPRVLTAEKQKRLIQKLKPFSGQSFAVVNYYFDRECAAFTKALTSILIAAGWTSVPPPLFAPVPTVVGVRIFHSPRFTGPAKALASALASEGVEVATTVGRVAEDASITLFVGTKP